MHLLLIKLRMRRRCVLLDDHGRVVDYLVTHRPCIGVAELRMVEPFRYFGDCWRLKSCSNLLLLRIQVHHHVVVVRAIAFALLFGLVMVQEVLASILVARVLDITLVFRLDGARLNIVDFYIL